MDVSGIISVAARMLHAKECSTRTRGRFISRRSSLAFTAVLATFLAQTASAQDSGCGGFFSTVVGGSGMQVWATDAALLPDGSIALAVCASDNEYGFGNPWVLVFDGSGALTWMDASGEAGIRGVSRDLESGGWLEALDDGSLLLTSYAEPRATGIDAEIAVLRVTPGEGTVPLAVIGASDDKAYCPAGIEARPDGSFVIIGRTCSMEDVPFEFVRDEHGGSEIRFDPSEDRYYFVEAFDLTPEGTLLICTNSYERWLVARDADGDTLSVSRPGSIGMEPDVSILRCFQDRIILAGSMDRSPWVACLDQDFRKVWEVTLPRFESGVTDMAVNPDGSLVVCGFYAEGDGIDEGSVLPGVCRLDPSGAVEWTRVYGGIQDLVITSVDTAPDGTLILSGSARVPDAESTTLCAWAARMDDDGLIPGSSPGDTVMLPDPARQLVMKQPLGMIAACGVFDSEESAAALADRLSGLAGLSGFGWEYPTGVTWIPQWASLSGAEAWLAYVGPLVMNDECIDDMMERISPLCPDAYLVWAGNCHSRVTYSAGEVSQPIPAPDWD